MEESAQETCTCQLRDWEIDALYVDMWGADTVLTIEEERALEPLMKIMRSFDKHPGKHRRI